MTNVLLVDDEPQNLRALKRELSHRNPTWTIHLAHDEKEASQILDQHEIDAIVTDLVMATEQSGIEVLRRAKAKDPLVMVILITAFEKYLDRYQAFQLGAFDCVQKNMPGIVAVEEISFKAQAALSFRNLARQQIEDQKRLTFLRRYFDPRVFDVLDKTPDVLNIRSGIVTICFWDIRGFSKLCESLKAHPTLIAGFLREYFRVAAEAIFKHEGVLDKFIGDGVMGLFGALDMQENDGRESAIHAVGAALELKRHFNQLLAKWVEEWVLYTPQAIDIGLGCGIHTGNVLVGNVGTEVRDQYTALGPNVNFAQRIEARSEKGEILLSASTETRVRGQFDLKESSVLTDIKNIAGEFKIFSVAGR
jgi:class 3 adenylate cyclase